MAEIIGGTYRMKIEILADPKRVGREAGAIAADSIAAAISKKGNANIILATGTSQFETLNALVQSKAVDWSKVAMFHLDEYVGMPETHPASFRRYLKERFISRVPRLRAAYLIHGDGDAAVECKRLSDLISRHPVDVALIGIGENGHLAFNDPPADFDTDTPYIVVNLDDACRKQQMGEGWFATLDEVPTKAISMSVRQIMKSDRIICSVPDLRKAAAVRDCVEGAITNLHPSSVLRRHADCFLFLDEASASLLSKPLS